MPGNPRTGTRAPAPGPDDRPRVTLNVAVSLDGRIAGRDGRQLLLSDAEDQKRVHRLRAGQDAILVGIGTVLKDDPTLLVRREWVPGARDPVRVILDTQARTPPDARVLDPAARTRIYCAQTPQRTDGRTTPGQRPPWIAVATTQEGHVDLNAVLADLGANGIKRLMVEGGGRVISSFLEAGLVDEAFVFIAPVIVGEQAPSLAATTARGDSPLAGFRIIECEKRETGVLLQLAPGSTA